MRAVGRYTTNIFRDPQRRKSPPPTFSKKNIMKKERIRDNNAEEIDGRNYKRDGSLYCEWSAL